MDMNYFKKVDMGLLKMKESGAEMVNQDIVAIWLMLSGYGEASEWINWLNPFDFDKLVENNQLI